MADQGSQPTPWRTTHPKSLLAKLTTHTHTHTHTHTGYDFTDEKVRDAAKKEIDQNDTDVIVMSPPCTKFSSQQRSNETKKRKRVIRGQQKAATMHIDFCIEIMKMQMAAGRYFIFEHPSSASSWELPRMMRLLKRQSIWEVESDQCQYGQRGGGNLPLRNRPN